MTTYVVSVGRCIGTTTAELPLRAWVEFRTHMRRAIESTGAFVVFDGDGDGEQQQPPEESATVIAVGELTAAQLVRLRRDLRGLASRYRQDEIALTSGTTEFLTPMVLHNGADATGHIAARRPSASTASKLLTFSAQDGLRDGTAETGTA